MASSRTGGTRDHDRVVLPVVKGALEEQAHGGDLLVNAGDFEKLAPAGTRWRLAGSL